MPNEDKKNPDIVKVDTPAPLTNEQLMQLLIAAQKETAQANKALADALLESRKPYVDPKVLEQKQQALKERQAQIQLEMRRRRATKAQCPHRRTNGDGTFDETRYNIKWQEHSQGIILGVCGTCFSQFDSRNPDDLKLLRLDGRAIKTMGRARENTRLM